MPCCACGVAAYLLLARLLPDGAALLGLLLPAPLILALRGVRVARAR